MAPYQMEMNYLVCRDYDLIERLQLAIFDDEPLEPEDFLWWVGREKQSLCAMEVLEDRTGYLLRAGVTQSYRGFGKHQEMINYRLSFARVYGIHTVIADTEARNVIAANNLIKCGFRAYNPDPLWNGDTFNYWKLAL